LRVASALAGLWSNWITLLGTIITTVSGFSILVLLVIDLTSTTENPYASLMVVVVLPVAIDRVMHIFPSGRAG
jgi:hypothetical protein